MPNKSPPFKDIGLRLGVVLRAVGKRPTDLVRESKGVIKGPNWSNWQSGTARISIDPALWLCREYDGLTLDYIYRGSFLGVDSGLRDKLKAQTIELVVTNKSTPEKVSSERKKSPG